jgi:hypothetical protein
MDDNGVCRADPGYSGSAIYGKVVVKRRVKSKHCRRRYKEEYRRMIY